jgi:SAM-dependent methyltransferase
LPAFRLLHLGHDSNKADAPIMSASRGGDAPSAASAGIKTLLAGLGAIREDRVELFAPRTRDVDPLPVWRDPDSGVIFIDGHYVGDGTYRSGAYRGEAKPLGAGADASPEDRADSRRRMDAFRPLVAGRRICDFGCGTGGFLRLAQGEAARAVGVELQEDARAALAAEGIATGERIADLSGPFDTIFLFHVLEHLPDPLAVLAGIRAHLAPGGHLVIEVPHARDFLLDELGLDAFARFTLWSQHLVLHTRASLRLLLAAAGFVDIDISGVQRYGLANHLTWLREGRPGGHRGPLATLETPALRDAYEHALDRRDATDTLIATARLP